MPASIRKKAVSATPLALRVSHRHRTPLFAHPIPSMFFAVPNMDLHTVSSRASVPDRALTWCGGTVSHPFRC